MCNDVGDGLDEDTYRERMLAVAEEREENRVALMDEGTQTRNGIYEQLIQGCGGIEVIEMHRANRRNPVEDDEYQPEIEDAEDVEDGLLEGGEDEREEDGQDAEVDGDPDYVAADIGTNAEEAKESAKKSKKKRSDKLKKKVQLRSLYDPMRPGCSRLSQRWMAYRRRGRRRRRRRRRKKRSQTMT